MSRPHILLSLALSADGRVIAPETCSEPARARFAELRQRAGALLASAHAHPDPPATRPRCVITSPAQCELHLTPEAPPQRAPLEAILHMLRERCGVATVLTENDPVLASLLAERDLIDEIQLVWSGQILFGGSQPPPLTGSGSSFLPVSRVFELATFDPHPESGECFLSYRRKIPAPS